MLLPKSLENIYSEKKMQNKWEFYCECNGVHIIPGFEDLFLDVNDLGNSHWMNSEPLLYKNYLRYLSDARSIISTSVQACQVWSAPYDGLDPLSEDYQAEDREKDEEDVCLPLTTPPLQPPTPHNTSLSRTPELEWDDSYDAAPDGEENQNFHFVKQPQPPKHIQDMRKSAILLIRGSYVEESEFQDDVSVYNLIAKRDARDDRFASFKNTPRNQNDMTIQIETNNSTHVYINSNTQHDALEKVPNLESEEASLRLKEHIDEKKTDQTNDTSAHAHQNQSTVLEERHQDTPSTSSVQLTGEDFISQCLQLIDWDQKSMLGDEVYFQRLTALLYGEETETDFNSICSDDDDDDDERIEGAEQRGSDAKRCVPFTGNFFLNQRIWLNQRPNSLIFIPFCRPFHQCAAFPPGEHVGEFHGGEPAGDGDPGSAGSVSTASAALLPAQYPNRVPAQRPFSLPGLIVFQ